MNSTLLLVRHSSVAVDPEKTAAAWPLSADGRARAQTFAQTLNSLPTPITRVITSQEPKAIETGAIMAAYWGVPSHAAPNLHEHDRAGMPYLADQAAFATAVAQFFAQPTRLVWGNETAVTACDRLETAVRQQLTAYPQDNLAIITHGTVLSLLITRHNPHIQPFPFWQALTLPCAFHLILPDMTLRATFLYPSQPLSQMIPRHKQ